MPGLTNHFGQCIPTQGCVPVKSIEPQRLGLNPIGCHHGGHFRQIMKCPWFLICKMKLRNKHECTENTCTGEVLALKRLRDALRSWLE